MFLFPRVVTKFTKPFKPSVITQNFKPPNITKRFSGNWAPSEYTNITRQFAPIEPTPFWKKIYKSEEVSAEIVKLVENKEFDKAIVMYNQLKKDAPPRVAAIYAMLSCYIQKSDEAGLTSLAEDVTLQFAAQRQTEFRPVHPLPIYPPMENLKQLAMKRIKWILLIVTLVVGIQTYRFVDHYIFNPEPNAIQEGQQPCPPGAKYCPQFSTY